MRTGRDRIDVRGKQEERRGFRSSASGTVGPGSVRLLVEADVKARLRALVGTLLGVLLFMTFMSGTYEAFGGAEVFNQFLSGAEEPSFFSAFTGSREVRFITGPLEYVAFGFNHPFFLVLGMLMGVAIGTDAVAGDVESGRAELLYTRPLPRTAIVRARMLLAILVEISVGLAAWLGVLFGSLFSSDVARAGVLALLPVVAQFLPLAVFSTALAFFASAATSRRGLAAGVTVAVLATGYLVNFVSLLWDPLGWASYFTPFGYFTPFDALGGFAWADAGLLSVAALVLFFGAFRSVDRRDLV